MYHAYIDDAMLTTKALRQSMHVQLANAVRDPAACSKAKKCSSRAGHVQLSTLVPVLVSACHECTERSFQTLSHATVPDP